MRLVLLPGGLVPLDDTPESSRFTPGKFLDGFCAGGKFGRTRLLRPNDGRWKDCSEWKPPLSGKIGLGVETAGLRLAGLFPAWGKCGSVRVELRVPVPLRAMPLRRVCDPLVEPPVWMPLSPLEDPEL